MPKATLKPRHEQRIARGHLWVYQGNIASIDGDPAPGGEIDVYSSRGDFLGRGYYNPRSQIAVRLLSREAGPIDKEFFAERIRQAQEYRARFVPQASSYRLIYSEGDWLPGLIADRYEDVLVVQLLTLGMDRRRDEIVRAMAETVRPRAIYERSDAQSRRHEGLEPRRGLLWGELPPQPMIIGENGLRFEIDVTEGQKTGYFLDQRENRRRLAPLVPGARVLDAFCHTGSFAIHALRYGAQEVLGVDSSEQAVAMARRNAALNGFAGRARFVAANAFDFLRELDRQGERFDCVILDPPAFAKGKAHVEAARRGYKEVNLRGIKLLRSGGFLVTCSCSHHMTAAMFFELILDAAADARRQLRLVETGSQAKDHPVLAGVPETAYLKCFVFQVF
ncbi:MAG: class I SAM-dependent rRNA methyltransferase [Firmicutes bacterium]|nr:class I SAM-dependent rRNA methyltransferase [Bacillota bacterium]